MQKSTAAASGQSQRDRCYAKLWNLLQSCPLRRVIPRGRGSALENSSSGGSSSSANQAAAAAQAVEIAAAPKPAPSETSKQQNEEERICRYCFEGEEEGELISPCNCTGGQKFVHLTCLRMWQRAVLISQPTHPDQYVGNDSRQRICNVCKAPFTCHPPTRMELMSWMTGPEIAALIEEGCLIGSAEAFSDELSAQISGLPPMVQNFGVVCRHWIRGVFLIVKVASDQAEDKRLRLTDDEDVESFLEKLEADAQTIMLRGRKYKVALLDEELDRMYQESTAPDRRQVFQNVQVPFTVKLRSDPSERDCGEDGVVAVNLTRVLKLSDPSCPPALVYHVRDQVEKAGAPALRTGSEEPEFKVQHFLGGPCEETDVAAAVVVNTSTGSCEVICGGMNCLERAFAQAKVEASVTKEGSSGSTASSTTAPVGAVQEPANKRQRVADATGEAVEAEKRSSKSKCKSNRQDSEDLHVHVLVFWGYAGWSRCQLMGEIARGSWGLCQHQDGDLLSLGGEGLWSKVYPRMLFAPKNEMSETYNRPEEEERRRQLRRMSLFQLFLRTNIGDRPGASQLVLSEDSDDEASDQDE
eukprot:CAMPEP_0178374594 /NCGR_PEP_ID=MMETSP0689_2-20121128/2457_1 /TAXON_ID=160604 /ORGANISM="Amphidinium massartii, Strain CS-259" /LENGTH=582 /DNA_ID=CAMNT_0019994569 /DNA_START=1 /DNA_END=1746 /DNA_ORIENTATION=+